MDPRCWFCDAAIDTSRIEREGVLLPRETSRGGPLWVLVCPECGTELGAERNAVGEFLVVPRDGPEPLGWVTGILDHRRLFRRGHARNWFRENADRRRAFHAASPRPRPAEEAEPSPRTAETEPEEEDREDETPAPDPPDVDILLEHYRRLDVPITADAEEVTAAYRRLSQKCHPDKVAHLDEEFQALADRKFRELRTAYEAILEALEGG